EQMRGQRALDAVQFLDRHADLAHAAPPVVSVTTPARPATVSATPARTGREAVVVGAAAAPSARPTRWTRAAPVLNSGCLEAGSQSVMVSSLAARPCPSGSCPAGVSQ